MTVLSVIIVLCIVVFGLSRCSAFMASLLTWFNIKAMLSESIDCDCWMASKWRVCNLLIMSTQYYTKKMDD